jgi:glyoxylase-like metal-dependent hydrolase (beta-lactamase superfamily II)
MKQAPARYSIEKLVCPQTGKNEYLLISNGEAAAIDVSGAYDSVQRILNQENNGKKTVLKYILPTHAHPSHLQAVSRMQKDFGAALVLHPSEYDLLKEVQPKLEPTLWIKDNQELSLGEVIIRVIHTPGHTKGSLCFMLNGEEVLFSGSTLLKQGYGRIWGPKSMSLMLFSLKRINYSIYADTKVYPRSGEATTVGQESWMNCLRSA